MPRDLRSTKRFEGSLLSGDSGRGTGTSRRHGLPVRVHTLWFRWAVNDYKFIHYPSFSYDCFEEHE